MEDDPQAELRHLLRNRLTVIRGWAQLAIREGAKPDTNKARLARYMANLDAGIGALDREIAQQIGPGTREPDATATVGES